MVAKGMSYKQIADRLVLSHRTVQNHVQNTLRKLQLHNRVELTRYAIEQGLDDDDDVTGPVSPPGVAPPSTTRRRCGDLERAANLVALGPRVPARPARLPG